MSRPLISGPSLRDFSSSLTALYLANAVPEESQESARELPDPRAGFEPSVDVPDELRRVTEYFFERGMNRYLDLLIVLGDEQYRVTSRRSMIRVPRIARVRASMAVIPIVSGLKAYMAEGERGLLTAVSMAGLLVGRFVAELGAAIGFHAELDAPPTLRAPIYLWRR